MTGSTPHPNILLMIPHDLGDFLHCYDHETVRSPNLDAMAARGVSFRSCFTTTPECTPSRGAMFTGLSPHQNGLMGLSNFGWSLKVPHLAARLRGAGYHTRQYGVQHETHEPPETLGYDLSVPGGSGEASDVCANVVDFLRSDDAASGEAPWFLCAGFRHVHRAWKRAERRTPDDVGVPDWLPDHPEVRKDLARFYEDIEAMDAGVGEVLSALADTGLDRRTLVIFTTDHGAAFPGAKATLYDPGVRVPLILHWPGHVEGGAAYACLLSNMDLTPTLLEVAGAPVPDELAGRSFLPLLRGEPYIPRDEVAGALFYDVAYDPMHYVRTATHKYIRSFAVTAADAAGADREVVTTFAGGRWVRVDDFDVLTSPSWQALASPTNAARPPAEELYDLRSDPCERDSLAGDPAAAPILADMRCRLRTMMEATASPLLDGHVPPPARQREAVRTHGATSPLSHETIAKRKALQ
ncbi:MAG: sulfatase [Planctomycetota bacterium]